MFLCVSVGEYLASPFAIVNSAVMNIAYMYLFENLSVHLGIYLEVKLLGRIAILCLAFRGTFKLFSTMAGLFYNPPVIHKFSSSFTSLPMLPPPHSFDNEVK